eukprot:4127355-Pyramimonas_sp.AAC.1
MRWLDRVNNGQFCSVRVEPYRRTHTQTLNEERARRRPGSVEVNTTRRSRNVRRVGRKRRHFSIREDARERTLRASRGKHLKQTSK